MKRRDFLKGLSSVPIVGSLLSGKQDPDSSSIANVTVTTPFSEHLDLESNGIVEVKNTTTKKVTLYHPPKKKYVVLNNDGELIESNMLNMSKSTMCKRLGIYDIETYEKNRRCAVWRDQRRKQDS